MNEFGASTCLILILFPELIICSLVLFVDEANLGMEQGLIATSCTG